MDGACGPTFHSPSAFDDTIMDGSVAACDSPFRAACGRWLDTHTDEDRLFSYSVHRIRTDVERIVTNATGNSPLFRFYSSCLDASRNHYNHEAEIEYRHIMDQLIGELKTYADLPTVFGRMARQGYTIPFQFSIERDPYSTRVIPYIGWDGYDNFTLGQVTSVVLMARPLTRYNMVQSMNLITRAWKIIDACRQHRTEEQDTVQFRHLPQWYTPHQSASGWLSFLHALDGSGLRFAAEQDVWTVGGRYLLWLFTQALPSYEVGDWIAYLEFSHLYHAHRFEPLLANNVYRAPLPPPSRDCVAVTERMLPGLLAKAFLDRVPNKERVRAQVRGMVEKLKQAYIALVSNFTWMSLEAKVIASDKISAIRVRVAEPDGAWFSEPFAERIGAQQYDHNLNLVRRYRVQRNLEQWSTQQAADTFAMPLTTVNAYYNPEFNSITILAGILGSPWYNVDYNDVSKYAIVGSIVGHELGHALDWHGLHWSKDGVYVVDGILDAESMSRFEAQVKAPVAASYTSPCNASYGTHTVNEAIADRIGMRLAYNALAPQTQGEAQFFFLTQAQVWCSSVANECNRVNSGDVHPLARDRVDVTDKHMPEFIEAFNCR